MTRAWIIALALLLTGLPAHAGSSLEQAIAEPARSEADRDRDARDRPATVLGLLDIQPGQQVADIFAGGGYYSELLSYVVGPQGRVLMRNNPPYSRYAQKDWKPRLANERLPNVEYAVVDNTTLALGEQPLDAALLIMTFHDLFYAEPEHDWARIDVAQFLRQIHAALKPGGRLLVTDHAARPGRKDRESKSLHRIEESFARERIEAAGFELLTRSDALRNPQDTRDLIVFDPAIRGRTDRFVHVYVRPGPEPARRFYY